MKSPETNLFSEVLVTIVLKLDFLFACNLTDLDLYAKKKLHIFYFILKINENFIYS